MRFPQQRGNPQRPLTTPPGLNVDQPTTVEHVKRAWTPALAYRDINDHDSRSTKAAQQRYDREAPVISRWADVEIWDKLEKIQDILLNDLSPYHLWPVRCLPSFKGDFDTVTRWTREQHPTWIQFLEKVIQEIGPKHHARTTTVALALFPREVAEEDTPGVVARKLRKATLQVPDLWASDQATRHIAQAHLEDLLPQVSKVMDTDHRSKESDVRAWLDAMVRVADQEEAVARKLSMPGVVPSFQRPISETVLAANQDEGCFNCGRKGHWAKDCKLPRKDHGRNIKDNNEFRKAFTHALKKQYNKRGPKTPYKGNKQRAYNVKEQPDKNNEEGTDEESEDDEDENEFLESVDIDKLMDDFLKDSNIQTTYSIFDRVEYKNKKTNTPFRQKTDKMLKAVANKRMVTGVTVTDKQTKASTPRNRATVAALDDDEMAQELYDDECE